MRISDWSSDVCSSDLEEPIVNEDGQAIFMRRRYNDRLLMFLLRAHHPERYARVDRVRAPDEETPAVALPVSRAIAALEPITPPEPHRLMPPETLEPWLPPEQADEPDPVPGDRKSTRLNSSH